MYEGEVVAGQRTRGGDQGFFSPPNIRGAWMKRITRLLPLGVLVLTGVLLAAFGPGRTTNSEASGPLGNQVLAHAVDVYLGRATLAPGRLQVSSGPLEAGLQTVAPTQATGVPSGRPNA